MTSRHLLALAACFFLSSNSGQAENLNWNSRKIQLSVQRDYSGAPVPTGITVRRGTDEIAVVGDDHLVRIKSRTTGKLIRLLDYHSDWVKIALYSPDGKTLYTAGSDRSIIAWNADNQNDFSRFATENRAIEGMAIDPQAEFLATVGFNNKLNLYNLADRKLIRTIDCPCADMRAIQFSPNSELLAVAGRNGTVRIIQIKDGSLICNVQAHRKRIRDLVFADNQTVLTCSDDRTIKSTDIAARKSRAILVREAKFYSLAYLGSNRLAAGASDNLIRIIDIKSGTETATLKGHSGTVCELVADGYELISGSFDTEVRVWQMENSFVSAPRARVSQARTSKPQNSTAQTSTRTKLSRPVFTNPQAQPKLTNRPIEKSQAAAAKPISSFQLPQSANQEPNKSAVSTKDRQPPAAQTSTLVPTTNSEFKSSFSAQPSLVVPGKKPSSGFRPKTNDGNFSNSQFQIAK